MAQLKTTTINGDMYFPNGKNIFGKTPDGTIVHALEPCTSSGNTAVGYGNYYNKSGNLNLYGYDVNIAISNIASPTSFRPYIRKGDSFTFDITTSGFITNGGTHLYFTVPFNRPFIGSPTTSAASTDGFTIRQNGNYLYGSTASSWTQPSSYLAFWSVWTGSINIRATFDNTTNVTNNSTCGINWRGTITFS